MSLRQLIDVLTDLRENRKLGSEADEAVRPFQGKNYSSGFSFGSSSRTFANPHDPSFEGGQTVTGEIAGEGLEFSLLLPESENEWVTGLERGEEFSASVRFLGFDGLYQRGIFGFLGKAGGEDAVPAAGQPEEAEAEPPEGDAEPDEDPPVDKELGPDLEAPAPARKDQAPDEAEEKEEDATDETGEGDESAVDSESSEADPPELVQEDRPEEEMQPATDESDDFKGELGETEEAVQQPSDLKEEEREIEQQRQDLLNLSGTDGEQPEKESEPEESSPVEKETADPEEAERVMERARMWGVQGLTRKEQRIYHLEKERLKEERWRLEKILDKAYEEGVDSLTPEELALYESKNTPLKTKAARKPGKGSSFRKVKAGPTKIKKGANRMKASGRRHPAKKKQEPEPGGCRIPIAIVFGLLALNVLGDGRLGMFFFFVLLAFLCLHPWLVKWMGEDFLQGFFPGESYEDKRFRRGCWLFLLGICTLNVFPLGIILLGIGLFMVVSSDSFRKLTKGK